MITVYTDKDYSKSYTELVEILKYFPKTDLVKIPKDKLLSFIKNRDTNYNFCYNPELDIELQNVSKLTYVLLANLYIDFLADKEEQKYIRNRDLQELNNLEKQNREKYDIDTIFSKRKKNYRKD